MTALLIWIGLPVRVMVALFFLLWAPLCYPQRWRKIVEDLWVFVRGEAHE